MAWGRQRRKHHQLCLITESAFKFISVTLARASPSGINDAGVISLLILHHCKIPGESLCFLPPSSSIHGVFVRSSRGKAVNMFGITLYTPPPRDSSQSISFTCLLHLTSNLPLSSLCCPPPKCICADGPIFPRPQTGDVIRGNLICLECSGDGRKLFCSSICKCIHHGVPGNPSP